MSVTILNKNTSDSHVAEHAAVIALAKEKGWAVPDGQSATLDNLITAQSQDAAPVSAPSLKPEP